MTDWNKLKVPELKAELKNRGLPQTGLKAALVARLSTAENESGFESEATLQDDAAEPSINSQSPTNLDVDVDLTPGAHIDNTIFKSPHVAPQDNLRSSVSQSPPKSAVNKETVFSEPQEISPPVTDASPTAVPNTSSNSNLAAFGTKKLVEDIQNRKKRSQSPPPAETDAPRKRARQDKELPLTDIHIDQVDRKDVPSEENNEDFTHDGYNLDVQAEEMPTRNPERIADGENLKEADFKVEIGKDRNSDFASEEDSLGRQRDSRFKELFSPPKTTQDAQQDKVKLSVEPPDATDAEPDRYVAPSIHPATSALYIRDFMRPLNPSALREHLKTLATPPGLTPDESIIVDFFLDPIRTHLFISFANIAAASRVRSELHERIWPDERPRKPLWVDFIPPDKIRDWVEEEKASGLSRSAAKKWEIAYNFDNGDVMVSLQEAGVTPASAARKLSFAPAPAPARSIALTQPKIHGAPSGPRAHQPSSSHIITSSSALDQRFRSTVTKPVLYFQPISKELADKRLDNIYSATSKHYSIREGGSEINRYTFEDGDVLVDRGPEIFSGIRPPPGYRGRGGGGVYRGGRGGRGGDRYEGRRRDDRDPRDINRRF